MKKERKKEVIEVELEKEGMRGGEETKERIRMKEGEKAK